MGKTRTDYTKANASLCLRIQSGDKKAECEMIALNDGFIATMVNEAKKRHMLTHLYEWQDAYQDCAIAMLEAARRYDPTKGGGFANYSRYHMFAAINNGWRERFPVHVPGHAEMAYRRGELPEDSPLYAMVERFDNTVPLDELAYTEECAGDIDEVLYEDLTEDRSFPDMALTCTFRDVRGRLLEMLKTLTPREQRVLVMRYGLDGAEPMGLEEIGKEFGVQRERIRQIEAKALRKMRHPSRSQGLEPWEMPVVREPDEVTEAYTRIRNNSCEDCVHYSEEDRGCSIYHGPRSKKLPHCGDWKS